MKYLRFIFNDLIQRPSLYLFVFVIIFSVDRHKRMEVSLNSNGPFSSDVAEYYTFLPECFLGYAQITGINVSTNKRTIGMAIMYSPAFFVGHAIAGYNHEVQDGYSKPYQWAVRWGSIIYSLLGLFFCRKNLLMFFKEPVVLIALACVFFGTNLIYYTYSSGEFPHSYLFFLNSLFIYFTLKWILEGKSNFLLALFITGGMITLIRPTGILVFLFPLLFKVSSLSDLVARIKYIFRMPLITFLGLGLFLLPLFAQALIWHKYQGHFFHYSYKEERFFFSDPQILNFLISIRKGWLVYTPIMFFSLIGIFLSKKRFPEILIFIVIYFSINVYVLSSWWDWSYGGSFGCRVLVESYAFLIFPFAVFVSWIWDLKKDKIVSRNVIRISSLLVFYFLIEVNFFQTKQSKYGRIHWSGMNWDTYKYVFLKEVTTEEINYLETRFTPPDPEKMKRGERDH